MPKNSKGTPTKIPITPTIMGQTGCDGGGFVVVVVVVVEVVVTVVHLISVQL